MLFHSWDATNRISHLAANFPVNCKLTQRHIVNEKIVYFEQESMSIYLKPDR